MAFPLLNIGILQSKIGILQSKIFEKVTFLKIQNSQATARYGVWKNTSFDNRKSSIKIYLSCLRKRTNVYNSEDMSFSFCLSQLLILFPLLYGLLKARQTKFLYFFISQVRELQMTGVKYLAECFSKKTQKSAFGRNYYQILMHKNQILCSIVWNYVHKKHAFKYFRHRETIFNHI